MPGKRLLSGHFSEARVQLMIPLLRVLPGNLKRVV